MARRHRAASRRPRHRAPRPPAAADRPGQGRASGPASDVTKRASLRVRALFLCLFALCVH
ncbi:hypothetical protein CNECB9_2670005 [Cupriavidus necator]|uniref:Uncharacterized protein n=1 Tax=Cupriavidus necator TaxID=106590 RepID=A0A1K0JDK3_CUPNE|nr:hypothetical protein CNECB9_2670005 [Cupriavidus necator]